MYAYDYGYEEDKLGMTVTSGCVTLKKDGQNLVGISIGGGAPYCPCLYVVQVFDSTPASESETLQAGDEVTGVNGISVKGKSKVETARLIQSFKNEVVINYNKLHADPKQGKTLDIDVLVRKFDDLNKTGDMFSGLMTHTKNLLRAIYELSRVYGALGGVFSEIGVKEPMARTSEAFTQFGLTHRSMERFSIDMLKKIKPIVSDLNTFLRKAIPDTRLTIKKYLDIKFEYLSYCLKVKELDDEEYAFAMVHEPLYRVETGNYEYRLILRCRQDARSRFAKMRSDVLVKLELLDNKHVQDTVLQIQRFINAMAAYHDQCYEVMKQAKIFPIEVDLDRSAFTYNTGVFNSGEDYDDDELQLGEMGEDAIDACERENADKSGIDEVTRDVQLIDLAALNTADSTSQHAENTTDALPLDLLDWDNSVGSQQSKNGASGISTTELFSIN